MIASNAARVWAWPLCLVVSGCALNVAPPPAPERSELAREFEVFEAPSAPPTTQPAHRAQATEATQATQMTQATQATQATRAGSAQPAEPSGSAEPTAPAAPSASSAPAGQPDGPGGALGLEDALRLAMARNPKLASVSWRVRAREAGVLQASLVPNPTLGVELENFAGSGTASGFDGSEATLWLSQPFELGGKRRKRHQIATLQQELAAWDREVAILDVLTETRRRFVEVVAAQQRLALSEDTLGFARAFTETVSRRVAAGRVSSAGENRAAVRLEAARIAQDHARHDLELARARLAAMWAGSTSTSLRARGELRSNGALPGFESLLAALSRSPEMARWETVIAEREAAIALERAAAIPDVTVAAGYRRLQATEDNAMVFASTLPLPLSDRNQGAVLESRYELARAGQQRREAELELEIALKDVYERAVEARHTARSLEATALPSAQEAFTVISEGYRNGRFSYIEVLDAQRVLSVARGELIEARAESEMARATLERMVATPLDAFPAQRHEH